VRIPSLKSLEASTIRETIIFPGSYGSFPLPSASGGLWKGSHYARCSCLTSPSPFVNGLLLCSQRRQEVRPPLAAPRTPGTFSPRRSSSPGILASLGSRFLCNAFFYIVICSVPLYRRVLWVNRLIRWIFSSLRTLFLLFPEVLFERRRMSDVAFGRHCPGPRHPKSGYLYPMRIIFAFCFGPPKTKGRATSFSAPAAPHHPPFCPPLWYSLLSGGDFLYLVFPRCTSRTVRRFTPLPFPLTQSAVTPWGLFSF